MRSLMLRGSLVAFLTVAPSLVLAHGGHGHTEGGRAAHFLTEPTHWMPVVLVGVVLVAGWLILRSARRSRV